MPADPETTSLDGQPRGLERGRRSRNSRTVDGDGIRTSRRGLLAAAGVGVAGHTLGLAGTAAAVGDPTPPLSTQGSQVVDPTGEPFRLRGFATAALDFVDYSWYPHSQTEVLERATDGETWHPNAVRLPVGESALVENDPQYAVDLLRSAVDTLAERGVYAVIDFHLIRPYVDAMGNAEGMVEDGWADSLDGLGFDPSVPTDQLLTDFWSAVAPEFADDDNVLFELFNEPTLPVSWSSYGEYGPEVQSEADAWQLWRETAQPWVDLIREHAPETPVIVGSPEWTSRVNHAPDAPFDGENIVYASHIYPDNGEPSSFDDRYGAPNSDVPIVVTEFGWDPDLDSDSEAHGTNSGWGEPFREWVEGYDNMGWLAWCFDDSWAPAFFSSPDDGANSPWTLKDGPEQHGGFVREWLQATAGSGDGGEPDPDPQPTCGGQPVNATTTVDGQTVCDVDGDGLYRDLDANGEVSHADVQAFFSVQHRPAWKQPELFDYNENQMVGHGDVVALFEDVAKGSL